MEDGVRMGENNTKDRVLVFFQIQDPCISKSDSRYALIVSRGQLLSSGCETASTSEEHLRWHTDESWLNESLQFTDTRVSGSDDLYSTRKHFHRVKGFRLYLINIGRTKFT